MELTLRSKALVQGHDYRHHLHRISTPTRRRYSLTSRRLGSYATSLTSASTKRVRRHCFLPMAWVPPPQSAMPKKRVWAQIVGNTAIGFIKDG